MITNVLPPFLWFTVYICYGEAGSDQPALRSFIFFLFILINRSGVFERHNVVSARQI